MDNNIHYKIAVVDDEEEIRSVLTKKLTKTGYTVLAFEGAEELIKLLDADERAVDLVISDIMLKGMDGIELLRYIDKLDNPIPILLITGHGNIEHAIQALRYGAFDFIRKPFDLLEITSSINRILRSKREEKLTDDVGRYILYEKRIFEIPSDTTACNVMSYVLTKDLTSAGLCNRTITGNISLVLKEAIDNAIIHGNLEISSDIIENQGIKEFCAEVSERKDNKKYADRKISIQYELADKYVEYIIEDEGPGFNHKMLPDPTYPENFYKNSGRGLLIIRTLMDEVDWNEKGNIIRLRKYKIKDLQDVKPNVTRDFAVKVAQEKS